MVALNQDFRHHFEMILEGARQLDVAKTTLQVRSPLRTVPNEPLENFLTDQWLKFH
jgi:hypothetical protein